MKDTRQKVLVTVAEAADMLSVNRQTVYHLAAAGELTKRYLPGSSRNFRLEADQVRTWGLSLPTEPPDPA